MAISSSSIIQSLNRMLSRLWNHNQMCCFPSGVSALRRHFTVSFVDTVQFQVDETRRVAACQTAATVALYQTLSVNNKC